MATESTHVKASQLPKYIVYSTIVLCILPYLLNLTGLRFGSVTYPVSYHEFGGLHPFEITNRMHDLLAGSYLHTILEWSAFGVAVLIAILAFNHYRLTKDVVTPLIGMVLFWAGSLDAFHILVADRLIDAASSDGNLIPFTWAICRIFNALMLGVGALLLLLRWKQLNQSRGLFSGMRFLMIWSLVVGFGAFLLMAFAVASKRLPESVFPDGIITRPYDVVPLVLYVLAGVFVFPALYRRLPSVFSHSLLICVIPHVAAQFHMAFGSTSLFDNHSNIAHFLKILAYFIPLLGLIFDYVRVYREQIRIRNQLEQEISIRKQMEDALRVSEERYMLALSAADLGTWDWDAVTGKVSLNERWTEMLGYSPEEFEPVIESWKNLIHPEDRTHVVESLENHLAGKSDAFEAELRLRSKTGDWIWVLDKGRVISRDQDGKPIRVTGTQLDITRRKIAEMELRESHQVMSMALAAASSVQRGMLPTDTEIESLYRQTGWEIAYYNQSCQQLGGDFFGMRPGPNNEILLYLADLAGHGIPVSLSAIGLQTYVGHLLKTTTDPMEVFTSANHFCCGQLPEDIYATMVYCRISTDTGKVEFINAGHQPVILLDRNNQMHQFESTAPALGMFENAEVFAKATTINMCTECRMLLFTDGVTELRNANSEFYGADRMLKDVPKSNGRSPVEIIQYMRGRLDAWRGKEENLEDDVTLVSLQWRPSTQTVQQGSD